MSNQIYYPFFTFVPICMYWKRQFRCSIAFLWWHHINTLFVTFHALTKNYHLCSIDIAVNESNNSYNDLQIRFIRKILFGMNYNYQLELLNSKSRHWNRDCDNILQFHCLLFQTPFKGIYSHCFCISLVVICNTLQIILRYTLIDLLKGKQFSSSDFILCEVINDPYLCVMMEAVASFYMNFTLYLLCLMENFSSITWKVLYWCLCIFYYMPSLRIEIIEVLGDIEYYIFNA